MVGERVGINKGEVRKKKALKRGLQKNGTQINSVWGIKKKNMSEAQKFPPPSTKVFMNTP